MTRTSAFLARGYARALFSLASRHQAAEQTLVWLETLAAAVAQPKVKSLLQNPMISKADKTKAVLTISQSMSITIPSISKLVKLLSDKNHLLILPGIYQVYDDLFFSRYQKLCVTIVSAIELTAEEQNLLTSRLYAKLNKQLCVIFETDKNIIGGVQIKFLDKTIDYSLQAQLSQLRTLLIT